MATNEKILFADDSDLWREAVCKVLEGTGHEIVAQAKSVSEVAAIVASEIVFTLALLDGSMPNQGDGERAAQIIRSQRPETKIVALSSDPQTFGDLNLKKDVRSDKLLKAIENL